MVLLSVMRRFLLSFLISIVIGSEEEFSEMQKNIYGDPLKICSTSPITGGNAVLYIDNFIKL